MLGNQNLQKETKSISNLLFMSNLHDEKNNRNKRREEKEEGREQKGDEKGRERRKKNGRQRDKYTEVCGNIRKVSVLGVVMVTSIITLEEQDGD